MDRRTYKVTYWAVCGQVKRKSTNENSTNVHQKKSTNTVKNQSKNVDNLIRHVAGENPENQAGLVAKYIDKKGLEFTAQVTQQSKQLKENRKFTPEQTAAIASNLPESQMDKMRTIHNNVFGSNPYASRHQVEKVGKEILVVNREDWEANDHDLYMHKQGNSVTKKTCVFSVKNLKTCMEKIANNTKLCKPGTLGGGGIYFVQNWTGNC